jgi:RNA ligase (TIGR02306 family)
MARKLVTVRRIAAVEPIKGVDRIEVAVVDGWRCIVKKGQFAAGDLGLFFEIDSFLPSTDERWSFLASKFTTWNGEKGFRVRSQRMRGQMSQGLLEPLASHPEVTRVLDDIRAQHGHDAAEKLIREVSFEDVLGVRK